MTKKSPKQGTLDNWCYNRGNEVLIKNLIIEENARRPLKQSRVEELARSIKERGLMNPIIITKNNQLIAGFHRVEAFRLLGEISIPCTFTKEEDPIELKLMEIDENNNRSELTHLELCEDLLVLKSLYEKKHPETKQGGDRKSEKIKTKNLRFDPFNEFTSKKLGISKRTIEMDVKVAKDIITDLKDGIRETKLEDRKTDLRSISKKNLPEQKEILEIIKELKKEGKKINDLKTITLKFKMNHEKMKEENIELKEKIYKILEKADRLIQEKDQTIEWLEDLVRKYDAIAYHYILVDGKISWDAYQAFWNTPEWKLGTQIRYRFDSLKGISLPPFERSRFHHESRRDWHRIFSDGYFVLDTQHKKGDSLGIEDIEME